MPKIVSEQALQDTLKAMDKEFGKAFNSRGIAEGAYEGIPTGCDELDANLTNGSRGVLLGGLIEVFGPEGSGKTSLAMKVVAQAQKLGMHCLWIDAEAGFSPDLAEVNGVDLKKLILPDLSQIERKHEESPIPSVGELMDMTYKAVNSEVFGVVVIDSIAGFVPDSVLAEDFDPMKANVGEVARAIGRQISKLHNACIKRKCTVIAINQLRAKIGDMYNPEDTPGGKALKFHSDQRLRVDRIFSAKGDIVARYVKDGLEVESIVGHYARIRIIKNKKKKPYRQAIEMEILYEKYEPDMAKRCFDVALLLQVITKYKGTYTLRDGDKVVLKADSEPEMLDAIRSDQLEVFIAKKVMEASKEDTKKEPTKVPFAVKELAETGIVQKIAAPEETPEKTAAKAAAKAKAKAKVSKGKAKAVPVDDI